MFAGSVVRDEFAMFLVELARSQPALDGRCTGAVRQIPPTVRLQRPGVPMPVPCGLYLDGHRSMVYQPRRLVDVVVLLCSLTALLLDLPPSVRREPGSAGLILRVDRGQ
jgi:hypothetical protein